MTASLRPDRRTPSNLTASARDVARPNRPLHRSREFGVGYGSSSGYASTRRYADLREPNLFRCG